MNLLILEQRAEEYREALEKIFPDLVIRSAQREEEAGDFVGQTDILVTIRVSDDLIGKAARLQWIHALTTGVDYIVNLPSLKENVILTSTRGIHGPQVSEIAFLFMLAFNRDFPEVIRNQDRRVWQRRPGKLLWKKSVGILGVGVIGEEIARKCKAFGMTVYGISRTPKKFDSLDYFYGPEDILQVIGKIDYFIIVAPHTPQTRRMIGERELAAMKPTAFLINLGRGEIVDEEALIHALTSGRIAGAALDTYWEEPLPKDHPFWKMKNVIVSPHVSGMSDIYPEQALGILVENVRRFLGGERESLLNVIRWRENLL